jgi:hypothetical protein
MKGFLTLLVVFFGLMAMSACEKSTVGARGKKLTLVKPADQTITRGETDNVKISIGRDAFRDAVEIKFEDLPTGVHVQDQNMKIAPEESSGTFTLRADPNAQVVKDHPVRVTVTGPEGLSTSETFKITVKDS